MEIEQNIFFDEFKNKLIILENSLIDIQNGNYNQEDINEVFRAIHTIKGTSDLLGMFDVVSISHKAEDLLQYVREDKIKMNSDICKLFIELKNFIALAVDNISQGIFDDNTIEKLYIDLEKEINYQIHIAETAKYEYEEVKTILVVDDSAIVRYSIKKLAKDEGYNVLTTDNAADALIKIEENAVDLLCGDFSTPNDSMLNLVKTIRADVYKQDLPIVMLLSQIDKDLNKIGKLISAKAWLKKPLDEKKLKLVLSKLL